MSDVLHLTVADTTDISESKQTLVESCVVGMGFPAKTFPSVPSISSGLGSAASATADTLTRDFLQSFFHLLLLRACRLFRTFACGSSSCRDGRETCTLRCRFLPSLLLFGVGLVGLFRGWLVLILGNLFQGWSRSRCCR